MLSYMLPVDEKPPPGPGKAHHLQLSLDPVLSNGRDTSNSAAAAASITTSSCISKENSISSFASDATTMTASQSSATPTSIGTDRPTKPKLLMNGKHQSLKRVSFGSSKGSMVETLVYETPVQEEPEPSPIVENETPFPEDHDQTEDEREKVRVSIVQQSKPCEVVLPDEPVIIADADFIMATMMINESNHIVTTYNRQESVESGWDNPFRPGGDLSREADEIVEMIKGGKPITPTSGGNASPSPPGHHQDDIPDSNDPLLKQADNSKKTSPGVGDVVSDKVNSRALTSTPKSAKNGSAKDGPNNAAATKKSDPVDVQRGTAGQPGDASQVEHIVIKKKPKCKCCVIQ